MRGPNDMPTDEVATRYADQVSRVSPGKVELPWRARNHGVWLILPVVRGSS